MTSVLLTLQRLVSLAAGLAIGFPVVAFLCWAYNPALLSSLVPSTGTVKPSTMAAVFTCGLSLLLQADEHTISPARRRIAQAFAGSACLLATATMLEYVLSLDLGVDLWLASTPEMAGDSHPGRMAPATSFAILMLGLALLTLDSKQGGHEDASHYLAFCQLACAYRAAGGSVVGEGFGTGSRP